MGFLNKLTNKSTVSEGQGSVVNRGLDWLLYVFSTFGIPALIGLGSVLALFAWKSQYSFEDPNPLEIRVVKATAEFSDPKQALARLEPMGPTRYFDTELSEEPFWLSFSVPKGADPAPASIEFPSRHALSISCWDASNSTQLGIGSRQNVAGDFTAIKAGFSLDLGAKSAGRQIVCRASSVGPARLSALLWKTSDLQVSAQEFHRKSGLLEGGILILAVFVLITALINRSGLYMLFAAWLVLNLRMGALSAGWDAQWLGYTVPQEWILRVRSCTLAVYYVLSVTLFRSLFTDDLAKVGTVILLRIVQWTCLPMLLLSVVLSYQAFLPFLWVSTGLFIVIMVFSLVRIVMIMRSPVAMWYGLANPC